MRIVLIGAGGFIGTRLAARLAATGAIGGQAIDELVLADCSRHGFVDGRALRLPIVLTRPGPASGSISDQVAALIREPLRGQRATCRMAPHSPPVTASIDKVVDGFLGLAALPASDLQAGRTMDLPGLAVTPAEIVQAVARHLPAGFGDSVDWQPDPHVQQIIDGWPQSFTSARALALGFAACTSTPAGVTWATRTIRSPRGTPTSSRTRKCWRGWRAMRSASTSSVTSASAARF